MGGYLAVHQHTYGVKGSKIFYQYFEISGSRKDMIHFSSAMGFNMKSASLVQELIRRLMNTEDTVNQSVRNDIIVNYIQKFLNSGYDYDQIKKFVISGILGYTRKLRQVKKSGVSVHYY